MTNYLNAKTYFLIGLGILIFLLLVFLRQRILKIAIRTREKYSFVFLVHFAKYLFFYFFLLLIFIFVKFFDLPLEIKSFSKEIIFILFVIAVSLPLLKFSDSFLGSILKDFGKDVASATIIKNVAKVLLIIVIVLIILSSLKISIAPILATLGVGGLTVAFALKDILANFFAGFYVIASKQLNVGDFVELETGEKGFIIDINWRITQLKLLGDKIILIPNAKFVESRIINHNLPELDVSVFVSVGVHYSSDLEFVEKITLEVAKQVMLEVHGGVKDFQPVVRYNKFDSSSINFAVILRADEFISQSLVVHEFIKRLHCRYKTENIKIPYPIIAVNQSQER